MGRDVEAVEECRGEIAVIVAAALPLEAAEEICSLMEVVDDISDEVRTRNFEAISQQACAAYGVQGLVGSAGWGAEFAKNFAALLTSDEDIAADFYEDQRSFSSWKDGYCTADGIAEQAPFFVSQGFWNEVGALVMSLRENDTEVATQIAILNAPKLLPEMRGALSADTKVADLAGGMRAVKRFWKENGNSAQITTMTEDTLAKFTMRLLMEMSEIEETDLIFSSFEEVQSSFDFEIWCAERMRTMDCPALLSPQGDHAGIDVITEVGAKKVGLRCEFHNTGSSERLVREAVQGMQKYDLDQGVIVFAHAVPADISVYAQEAGLVAMKASDFDQIKSLIEVDVRKTAGQPHLI